MKHELGTTIKTKQKTESNIEHRLTLHRNPLKVVQHTLELLQHRSIGRLEQPIEIDVRKRSILRVPLLRVPSREGAQKCVRQQRSDLLLAERNGRRSAGLEQRHRALQHLGQLQGQPHDPGQRDVEEELAAFVVHFGAQRMEAAELPDAIVFRVVGENGRFQVLAGGQIAVERGADQGPAALDVFGAVRLGIRL